MSDLLTQFNHNWADKQFAPPGSTVLLAISGGVDSMVMADLFRLSGIPFAIAHCNFQLRGTESDADEDLVRNWAAQHHITFHTVRFDTSAKVTEWKKGIQETARILRYEWLELIRREHNYHSIATAHHANDNAETLLMNLFRGTGIAGLHGIPERNDRIIRPLLFATRHDILGYAQTHHITWREDASNAKDDYLRNAVRIHLLPAIDRVFPNVVHHLSDSITRFAEAEVLYRRSIEQERKKLIEQRGKDLYIPVRKLRLRTPLSTICYELCSPYGFTAAQVPHILALMESESGHYISSSTHRIIRHRDFLVITVLPPLATDMVLVEGFLCKVELEHFTLHFEIVPKPAKIPADPNTAFIDMKRVALPLTLRKWRTGDYFYPIGMNMKKKKLSKFFIDQKLSIHEKERIWVLESQQRIGWIAGFRLDERFKITEATQEVLKITLRS